METYINKLSNTLIRYPASWENIETESTVFLLIRPVEEVGQIFRENVNLIIDNRNGLNLQEFVGAAKVQLRTQLPNYKEISTDYIELGGKQYARIVYQHSTNNLPLQVAYYIYIHKNKAYNLTCSSTQSNFELYLPIFEKMISSFTILN
ncbi:MAG TPA: PsbP-related protein [Bacteroidales bacterium]|nr:PsbP-related protein [Bacteroidales bacterium]